MNEATRYQLDRLDRETEELLTALTRYSHTELNTAPTPGAWSAVQTMHHLILTETGSLQYLRKKLSFDPSLQRAGLAEKIREWVLALYFRTGWKRTAPTYLSGDNLPREATLAATTEQWQSLRREYRGYLDDLAPTLFDKSVFNHPMVGRMSLSGMLYFHLLHFRHHRKQVWAAAQAKQRK